MKSINTNQMDAGNSFLTTCWPSTLHRRRRIIKLDPFTLTLRSPETLHPWHGNCNLVVCDLRLVNLCCCVAVGECGCEIRQKWLSPNQTTRQRRRRGGQRPLVSRTSMNFELLPLRWRSSSSHYYFMVFLSKVLYDISRLLSSVCSATVQTNSWRQIQTFRANRRSFVVCRKRVVCATATRAQTTLNLIVVWKARAGRQRVRRWRMLFVAVVNAWNVSETTSLSSWAVCIPYHIPLLRRHVADDRQTHPNKREMTAPRSDRTCFMVRFVVVCSSLEPVVTDWKTGSFL